MFWRLGLLAIVSILISGCVTERGGADFAAMARQVGPPKAGQARIVVLREKGFGGLADQGWDVKLDGGPLKSLKTGTYIYADRPAGRHQLTSTEVLFPGVTQRDISAEAGHTYFFLARVSDRSKALAGMAAAGGIAGLLVGAAVTSGNENQGPLDLFPLEEAAARDMMVDLRLAE
jgi:hypothetical protein